MARTLLRRYRLLIADDDAGVRDVLRVVFEPRFDLVEAASGDEAMDLIERTRVDIAVLDMYMPPRTGLETLRVLKRVHAAAPGILLTADATDALRRDAAAARAFTVLPKPFRKADLLEAIDAALRSAYDAA